MQLDLTRWVSHGIELEHALNGKRETVRIPVVSRPDPDDLYDCIIVLVRKNQIPDVLPLLSGNRNTPNILFMVNNPSGYEEWITAVGAQRLVLGFAGAGGTRIGSVIHYTVVSGLLQPTTFGELDGSKSQRIAVPLTPPKLGTLEWVPTGILIVEHAMAAADEMAQIAREFKTFADSTSIHTPAMDELRSHVSG